VWAQAQSRVAFFLSVSVFQARFLSGGERVVGSTWLAVGARRVGGSGRVGKPFPSRTSHHPLAYPTLKA